MNPDPYRGVFGSDGEKYAKDLQDLIDFGTSGNVAAFLSESIQACTSFISNLFIPSPIDMTRNSSLHIFLMCYREWGEL
jgi:hypothetical protein